MIYCTLNEAFGNEYDTEIIEQPKVHYYTCTDFREHLMTCTYCATVLAETRTQFNKEDDGNNMVILFLILLLIWSMTYKN